MRQWRWLPVVVLLAVTSLTLAPAGAAQAQTPKRGGVFHVPTPEAPSLDPHVNAGFVTHLYATPVYGGLVRFPAAPGTQTKQCASRGRWDFLLTPLPAAGTRSD